jgi:hypothetical protein
MKYIFNCLYTLFLLLFSIYTYGQTYYLSSSGGSYATEKWMSLSTGINGTGTVVWSQGNGTIGNAAGLLTNESIDLSAYSGQTLYLNSYDKYDDSWDGTLYTLEDASSNVIINNSGSSPDDGQDTDQSTGWDGTSDEIEISESFTVSSSGSGGGSSATVFTLNSSGGSYATEKWMNITTAVNGGGTQVWAQGNGTIGNGAGLLTNESIDLTAYAGQTLYINAWDKYGDGWDGSVYDLKDGSSTTVANNGGVSPDDGTNTDASSGWDGTSDEIESSESFTVPSTGPYFSTNVSSFTGLDYCLSNGPSTSQNFTVNGSSLTDDLTLTASSDFEISTDNSTFSTSLTLSKDGSGNIASTTIYARLKSGKSQGAYNGQIDLSSTGATSITITLTGSSVPTTIYVSTSGNDGSGNGSGSSPYLTLSKAISVIQSSCGASTVYVAAGTYNDINVSIITDNVTIEGDANGNTIFEGNNYQNRFLTIEGSNITIKNLKIQKYGLSYSNCNISGTCGGGAMVIGDGSTSISNVILEKVIFYDNFNDGSSGDGGALHIQYDVNTTINKCKFIQNYTGAPSTTSSNTYNNGGAVYVEGEVIFNNCEFYRNISKGYGSAVYVDGLLAEADFYHSTISNNNSRGNYGAVTVSGGFLSLYNSIAYNNLFSSNSLGNDFYESSGLLISSYSCYRDDYNNRSNISNSLTSDPLFTDEANNDFSLQSTSPVIDAGISSYSLADDITGLSRPQGSGYDMGAYEFSMCNAPTVTYNVIENCSSGTFTVEATVTSYGDGTSADLNDGTTTYSNASLNTVYTFGPYSTSSTVTLYYIGASYGGCDNNSDLLSGCVPNTCADAIDLSSGNIVADFSAAVNDSYETDNGGEPNYLQVGNGTTISNCNGGGVHNAYDYTEYKDLWYKVVVPSGDDEFTLNFSNVNGHYVVIPYYGSCGSLTQMTLLYNSNQSITGVIDNDGNNWFGDDPYVTPSITTLDFKGSEILNAPGGVVFLRIFPYDGGQGGSSGCIASNFSTSSLTINSSIASAATRTTVQNGILTDVSTWDCNCLPASTDNLVINHTISQPAAFAIGENNTLTINSGGQLNIQVPEVMNIDGILNNQGVITGTVYIAGTNNRSINLGTIDDVAITTSATVTLTANAYINKTLTLTAGTLDAASYLVNLESDQTTTALIADNGGTFTGNINMKRYVQNALGHHFLSSPVSNATVNELNDDVTLDLASTPFPNIYYYDEANTSADYEDGWESPSTLSHNMSQGEGYSLYFNASTGITIDIEGSPATGNVTRSLDYTAGSNPPTGSTAPQGWNFVGNPYPSPIDFDLLMANASSSIESGCYTWDPLSSSYHSYIGGVSSPSSFNNYIHSMQGFWVRTTGSANLNFTNSIRLTDPSLITSSFLKSNSSNNPIIRLSLIGQTSDCETVVTFRDMATVGFDKEYDAHYLKSEQTGRVELASDINSGRLRINSLGDDLSKNLSIPLMNKVSEDTTYTIKLTEFLKFDTGTELYLEDKVLNTYYNLTENAYIFNSSPADRVDRFVLHLSVDGTTINTQKIEHEEAVQVYKCEESLCIEFTNQTEDQLSLVIYNKTGKLIYRKKLYAGHSNYSLSDIYLSSNDIYIVCLPERGFFQKIKW